MASWRRRRQAAAALVAVVGMAAVAQLWRGPAPPDAADPESAHADGASAHTPATGARVTSALAFPSPPGAPAVPATLATTPPGLLRLGAPAPSPLQYPQEWHEFYFTRAAYSSYGRGYGGRGNSWAIDYPKADIQFLTVLKRLTNLDAYDDENAVLLTDPRIRNFPFLYALEVGYMSLSEAEVEGLRDYLLAGGFLVIDDFWGSQEWAQFEFQMKLVFPGREIIDLDPSHTVFNTFYEIDEILQVPAYGRYWGGRTYERDGYVPYVKGIQDDDGRLMVIINWNTDLGDAWEWAEQPDYPVPYSTFAFQMGVNMIVYAMTH